MGQESSSKLKIDKARSVKGGDCRANVYNCADAPNPLPAPDTVWLEEMTWMDVRDALATGKTTAIVPTGGMEPNGPWLATGKHNYVLHVNCDAIARKLGLSRNTVRNHGAALYRKIGIHKRSEAVVWGRENGFPLNISDG